MEFAPGTTDEDIIREVKKKYPSHDICITPAIPSDSEQVLAILVKLDTSKGAVWVISDSVYIIKSASDNPSHVGGWSMGFRQPNAEIRIFGSPMVRYCCQIHL